MDNREPRTVAAATGILPPGDTARRLRLDGDAVARLTNATAAIRLAAADPGFAERIAAARRIMDKHRGALAKLAE